MNLHEPDNPMALPLTPAEEARLWGDESAAAEQRTLDVLLDSKDMVELSRIAAVLFHDDAYGETPANARLIAASPTMYDYLVERAQSGDARAASIVEAINA